MKKIHLVIARDGEYEDQSWYVVSGWPTRRSALDEVDRLNDLSRAFQGAKREFPEPPDLTGSDEQYDSEYDKWVKQRDAMVEKFRRKMRVPKLDHYDAPSFSVQWVRLHTIDSGKASP